MTGSPASILFDRERGLPQFTLLGITVCWRDAWHPTRRGLEVVIARRWRILYLGFHPRR